MSLDPKFEAVLQKIRKKSFGSFNTMKAIQKILAGLGGWEIEPIVGLVPTGLSNNNEAYVYGRPGQEDEVRREWAELKRDAVNALPSNPKAGEQYILNLAPLAAPPAGSVSVGLYATYNPYIGAKGFRVTWMSTGQHFDLLPSKFEIERNQLYVTELWRWLLEESPLLPQVNEVLGTQAHVPAGMRTRDNTGTCPVCFRNIKLDNRMLMVLHGYQRPRYYGGTVGRCYGVGYQAYELSPEGTQAWLEVLQKMKAGLEKEIRSLIEGTATQIYLEKIHRTITNEDPKWPEFSKRYLMEKQSTVRLVEADIQSYTAKVRAWKLQPLPSEVGRVASRFLTGLV